MCLAESELGLEVSVYESGVAVGRVKPDFYLWNIYCLLYSYNKLKLNLVRTSLPINFALKADMFKIGTQGWARENVNGPFNMQYLQMFCEIIVF